MSSEIEGVGVIAAAVVLGPAALGIAAVGALAVGAVGVTAGVGWAAMQAGQAVIGANEAVNDQIRMKQMRKQQEQKQRRLSAVSGHDQLVQMCRGAMAELEKADVDPQELAKLKYELQEICAQAVPEDTGKLESLNSLGMSKLRRIMDRHKKLEQVKVSFGAFQGMPLAQLMESLRLSVEAAEVARTEGKDVQAANPEVLERAQLNQRLTDVSARVMTALEFVVDLGSNYGISDANQAWFQSCFGGVDQRIAELCAPTVSNAQLKKGIRALEEMMQMYDSIQPGLEKEKNAICALYPAYKEAAEALAEPVQHMRHFKSAKALREEMQRLQQRVEQAQKCAEIYKKLGPAAYMCFAWDQELQAMGYAVRKRSDITEMADYKPERAKVGEAKMPFYRWSEEDMTQIYAMASDCDLQLIVHPDGTTTLETIARTNDHNRVVQQQKTHCEAMKELYKRLRENWFIVYDYDETAAAEQVQSLHAWRSAEDNRWTKAPASGERVGERQQEKEQVRHDRTMQNS